MRPALIFVIFGPGGAGKGTVASALVQQVPRLWLSRSWTTRARRPGEPHDAYHFVDWPTFEARIADGGFLEWAEFLGELMGTPRPDPPPGHDVLLEIDVQGARQVRERVPESVLVLLVPPSVEVQQGRLQGRGDPPDRVAARVALAPKEEAEGRELADAVVVNEVLDRAVDEVAAIVEAHRSGPAGR